MTADQIREALDKASSDYIAELFRGLVANLLHAKEVGAVHHAVNAFRQGLILAANARSCAEKVVEDSFDPAEALAKAEKTTAATRRETDAELRARVLIKVLPASVNWEKAKVAVGKALDEVAGWYGLTRETVPADPAPNAEPAA